jgi:hypothetical protein
VGCESDLRGRVDVLRLNSARETWDALKSGELTTLLAAMVAVSTGDPVLMSATTS